MNKLKYTFLIAASTLACIPAFSQEAHSGIKGGLNFSSLYVDDVDDENMRVGYNVGVFTQILAPSKVIGFQPELAYSTKGARDTYDIAGYDGEVKFNLNYIDLPLLMVIKMGDLAEIHVGGYASYLVGVNVSTDGDLGDDSDDLDRDNFNTFDYGLAGGFAFNFDVISLGVRYNYGLQQIAKSDEAKTFLDNSKNANGQVYIAFNLQ